jgi:hypothetical protein
MFRYRAIRQIPQNYLSSANDNLVTDSNVFFNNRPTPDE